LTGFITTAQWAVRFEPVMRRVTVGSAESVFGESTGNVVIAWDRDLLRGPRLG